MTPADALSRLRDVAARLPHTLEALSDSDGNEYYFRGGETSIRVAGSGRWDYLAVGGIDQSTALETLVAEHNVFSALLDVAEAADAMLCAVQERAMREEDGRPATNADPYDTENPALIRETKLRPAIWRLAAFAERAR